MSNTGLNHEWDVPLYGKLLEIGGGKERMTKYFMDVEATAEPFKSTKARQNGAPRQRDGR